MARARISEVWSYCCGEKGRNRVRVCQRAPRGKAQAGTVFLQFIELEADGRLHRKRVSLGRCSHEAAKAKADALAGELAALPGRPEPSEVATVATLFDNYAREVTPARSRHAQQHDRTAGLLFVRSVGKTVSRAIRICLVVRYRSQSQDRPVAS